MIIGSVAALGMITTAAVVFIAALPLPLHRFFAVLGGIVVLGFVVTADGPGTVSLPGILLAFAGMSAVLCAAIPLDPPSRQGAVIIGTLLFVFVSGLMGSVA